MARNPLEWLLAYFVEPFRQIALLVREAVSIRRLLLNRFVILAAVLLLATVSANAYMTQNADNRLTGTVVAEDGTPVENATVQTEVVGIENIVNTNETTTDPEGQFSIPNYSGSGDAAGMELRIRVTTEDGYESPTVFRHAYFPDQNMNVRIELSGQE
ncbi:carboxypeptidase-like regulatory domain-containing protein [Haloarcula montana]|uniref:carboxypeptidase-like regulatory domain-containing protein n=1 Tax=Haloarcula montana TaxID=3111776 RepID=UPI002D76DEA4|nr:carboxypeptidase-like regulatory domain-containing protein [Haloarcula sp. GH36]